MAREMLSGETCGNPSDPPAEPITDLIECLERPGVDTEYNLINNDGLSYGYPVGFVLKQPNGIFKMKLVILIKFQI